MTQVQLMAQPFWPMSSWHKNLVRHTSLCIVICNLVSNSQLVVILAISLLSDTISISRSYKNLSVASCMTSCIRIHHGQWLEVRLGTALLLKAPSMSSIQLLLYIMLQAIRLGWEACTKSEFVPRLAGEVDIPTMTVCLCSMIRHYLDFKVFMWHGSGYCFRLNTGGFFIHVLFWIGFLQWVELQMKTRACGLLHPLWTAAENRSSQ